MAYDNRSDYVKKQKMHNNSMNSFDKGIWNSLAKKLSEWKDIVSISACNDGKDSGNRLYGLRANGTIASLAMKEEWLRGRWFSLKEIDEVSKIRDIVSIAANAYGVLCLKADGTVEFAGEDSDDFNINGWKDIITITPYHGIKKDGTVVTALKDIDISNWHDIISVYDITSSYCKIVVGLKSNGTIVISKKDYLQHITLLKDIVDLSKGNNEIIYLSENGSWLRRRNSRGYEECFINDNITAVYSCKYTHEMPKNTCSSDSYSEFICVKNDGTVVTDIKGFPKWDNIGAVSLEELRQKAEREAQKKREAREKELKEYNQRRQAEEQRYLAEQAEALRKREEQQKQRMERERKRKEQQDAWEGQGLCRNCGGQFGGLFKKKCKFCGSTN